MPLGSPAMAFYHEEYSGTKLLPNEALLFNDQI